MIALERRHGTRTSRGRGIGRVAKPQPEMVRVHRSRHGIRRCVEGIRLRGGAGRRSEDKKLAAENPTKLLTAPALLVGHDIALIPGHPKGPRRNLQHEDGELRIRREAIYADLHTLVSPARVPDRYVSLRVR